MGLYQRIVQVLETGKLHLDVKKAEFTDNTLIPII